VIFRVIAEQIVALTVTKLESRSGRVLICAAAILVVFGVWISAKWHFANALSTRAELKEVVDLSVSLAPSDPQTRFAAAATYRRTFDPADQVRSLAEYELVAALSPNNYLCWLELGRAREQNGDRDGAELALKRALDLAPNYAEVQWAYGNVLIRSGKGDEGLAQIRSAASANSKFVLPAVGIAMEVFGGEANVVRQQIGDTQGVNAAIAEYLARQKRFDEAAAAWKLVSSNSITPELKEAGNRLFASMIASKQYRSAAKILADLSETENEKAAAEKITDGGFESGVKLKGAREFEWQVAEGTEPQIAISRTQKHGGESSLLLVFNTMQASDFRAVGQLVAVEPGAAYEVELFYRSEIKKGITVRWDILNAIDGAAIAASMPVELNSEWKAIKITFTVPKTTDGIILRLVRDQCPSTVCPINGSLWFDDISIKRL